MATIKVKRSAVAGRVPATTDLELGEIAINTYDGVAYIKKSVSGTDSVVQIGSANLSQNLQNRYQYIASAGQTTFAASYLAPYVDVYLNGIRLIAGVDYTATSGTNIVLASGASVNNTVDIVGYTSYTANANFADLTSTHVTTALGYTPYNATNPSGYITNVISANSSSDALRITQTGAGNAILVEDSANPDSTPFVVANNGQITSGYTNQPFFVSGVVPNVASIGTSNTNGGFVAATYSNDANPAWMFLGKSRGAIGLQGVVASGDNIGNFDFSASDGTIFTTAARIAGFVDGTPGTNDMPGRLVFSTTADGASTPTERMRIDSAGNVGIGATPSAGQGVIVNKVVTGNADSVQVTARGAFQSDVTSSGIYFRTVGSTQATAFTLGEMTHFSAQQTTLGAGSTVTNQIGFNAASSLTGATNNYGFYGNIASGTNRYNLYMAGTANNYLAGSLGIGDVPATGVILSIRKGQSGATSAFTISARMNPAVDVTSNSYGYVTFAINAVGTSTTNFTHFYANQGTFSGTAPTNQYGFFVENSLTGATNNYGFYSNIASGTGRYNFYAAGTAGNFFGGNTVISVTDNTNAALRITQLGTGNAILVEDEANPDASPFVINADGRVMSGTTTILTASDSLIPRIATYNGQFGTFRYLNDAASNSFLFNKSRGTGTTQTIVQSADALGTINFAGSDGTNFISSARIEGAVDGTPGTNDMPGRLVFSTTADGASTPTERFRIASTGAWGLSGANYGTSGQVLTSGGSGAAPTWTTVSGGGGGSPAGSTGQFQYNNAGSFAAAPAMMSTGGTHVVFDPTSTNRLEFFRNVNNSTDSIRWYNETGGPYYYSLENHVSSPYRGLVWGNNGFNPAGWSQLMSFMNMNVGIGTKAPGAKFHISDGSNLYFGDAGGVGWSGNPIIRNPANSGYLILMNGSTGGVGLTAGGGSWTSISDERHKTNLVPIENGLSKVMTLRAVTGRYVVDNPNASRSFLIAQDVQKVLPEAVSIADDGRMWLGYTDTIPLLVAAIKELKAEFDAYKLLHP